MSMKPGVGAGQPSARIELAQLAPGCRGRGRRTRRSRRPRAARASARTAPADRRCRAAPCWPRPAGAAERGIAARPRHGPAPRARGRATTSAARTAAQRAPARRVRLDGDDLAPADSAVAARRAPPPGPAPPVEHARRLEPHRRQALGQAPGHLEVQPGRLGPCRHPAQRPLDRDRVEAAPARAIVAIHGGQYIEPMPATRPLRALRGRRIAAAWRRWPSLCAACRGWGRGRVCADCRARFAPVVPRCRRCALQVPAGVEICGDCLPRRRRSTPPSPASTTPIRGTA